MKIEIKKLPDGAVYTNLLDSTGRWIASSMGRWSLKHMIKKFCK